MKKSITFFKFLSLIIFNTFVFVIQNPFILAIFLAVSLVLLIPAKTTVKKRLVSILPIALIILLSQILFYPSLPITERLIFGFIAAIKIVLISLSVLVFLTYTSLFSLVKLFSFLPKDWLLLFLITAYLIPCILQETEAIKLVQKSRSPNKNVRSIVALVVPLLHRVFKRAEILSLVIVARGYNTSL